MFSLAIVSALLVAVVDFSSCSENTAEIKSLHVVSHINSRFANTLVTSVVTNTGNANREAQFSVQLPGKAFPSNFTMYVNNSLFIGKVKGRKEAEKEFKEAKDKGLNTGIVKTKEKTNPERSMDIFEISVSVPAKNSATFQFTYQQLLERSRGHYEHVISIRPKQVVQDLRVDVYVNESQPLQYLDVMQFRKSPTDPVVEGNSHALRDMTATSAHVTFAPTAQQQKAQGSETGLSGDFIIRYDVEHKSEKNNVGLIQSEAGFFVHYFSPSGLRTVGKNVIFVIDISGSMGGDKIKQTRDSMQTILGQLREDDGLNIILFNSAVQSWKPTLVKATAATIKAAKTYVTEKVQAEGGTNINDALLQAIKAHKQTRNGDDVMLKVNAPMIVFLTDGMPTIGEKNTQMIRSNVKGANTISVALFSLGFGDGVNIDFLRALSLENRGFARKIYTDKDASGQLEGFFLEVESPLLTNVKMEYSVNVVEAESVTSTSFPTYFNGSELVVAGKIKGDATPQLLVTISGKGRSNEVEYKQSRDVRTLQLSPSNVTIPGFIERLWAYLTIKQLLNNALVASSEDKALLEARALSLSLQYSFVTPLTAFIVVENDKFQDEELPTGYATASPNDNKVVVSVYTAGDSVYTAGAICNRANWELVGAVLLLVYWRL